LVPVFSVSASAISIDGYDVFTNVYDPRIDNYKEFQDTLSLDSSTNPLIIIFDIHLPEVIKKNALFDIEVKFSLGEYDYLTSFADMGGSAYDSEWNELNNDLDAIIEDGVLKETDIIAEGDIKYIRYTFTIFNPTFHITNSSANDLKGTTWLLNYNWQTESGFGSFPVTGYAYDKNAVNHYPFETLYLGWANINNKLTAAKNRISFGSQITTTSPTQYYIAFNTGDQNTPDIAKLRGWLESNATLVTEATTTAQYTFDFSVTSVKVTEQEEGGFLSGIFNWIKKVFNAIINLPFAIAEKIKALFVPSEDSIVQLKEKFEALLADRFGGAYQALEIVAQFGQTMSTSTLEDTQESITFPSVTVPLAGTQFSFGGWEVDVIPKGFEALLTPLKLIVDIVCTVAFINALKKRMEEVLK
jgi:hypothetical protein